MQPHQRVLCKFRCWEKSERVPSMAKVDGADRPNATMTVRLTAVKDEVFGPYTPSGNLDMQVTPSAGALFTLGEEYYLTFEPVTVESSKQKGL